MIHFKKVIAVFMASALVMTGCGGQGEEEATAEPVTMVETTILEKEKLPETLSYIGTVKADETSRLSFKMAGRLTSLAVEKGDYVEQGQEIARLEGEQLQYAVQDAEAQLQAARASLEEAKNGAVVEERNRAKLSVDQAESAVKQAENRLDQATEAYDYAKDFYEKQQALYEAGATSQQALDQAELDYKVKKDDYNSAQEQYKSAQSSLESAKEAYQQVENGTRDEKIKALTASVQQAEANLKSNRESLSDTVLYAASAGYITEVPVESGEIVSAGTPIAMIRTPEKIVQTGVTQQDVTTVEPGTTALIKGNDTTYEGQVTYVKDMPDPQTSTYQADIALSEEVDLPIGQIVDVTFQVGESAKVAIPIKSILNDGEGDYVYVMDDGRSVKKSVTIETILESRAVVGGLKEGDQLITKGYKDLRPGTAVKVSDPEDDEAKGDEAND